MNWKAEKVTLEPLYYSIDLMVVPLQDVQHVNFPLEQALLAWDGCMAPGHGESNRWPRLNAINSPGDVGRTG